MPAFRFFRSQALPAKSSGEAEFYAQVTLAAEGLFLKAVMIFLTGRQIRLIQYCDSSVAKAMTSTLGVGKQKHLQISTLWLQWQCKEKNLFVRKIGTDFNKSDLGTKVHSAEKFDRLQKMNNISSTPKMHEIETSKGSSMKTKHSHECRGLSTVTQNRM